MRLKTILRLLFWVPFIFINVACVLLKKTMRYFIIFMHRTSLFITKAISFIAKCFNIKLDEENKTDNESLAPKWLSNNPKISGPVSLSFKPEVSNVELRWFSTLLENKQLGYSAYPWMAQLAFIFNILTMHKLSLKKFIGKRGYVTII